ncbi:similar to Saccharomyces cerevisiae YLR150W STM1 Protein required for optimal translation under nutrient stress [Maudiozyma saulgeensis]|uniref:Similar to Saccharomyces cerevisiae YLR150W STM1 Protein required for optimal translation under nutrient stress n=1 Tax=Maudiozyma saulgeensis TaxID=1789683 RepID=A0A1X7R603_9SACH|nr:similar to Saccharomyces cerevisiae YLR150W STM1 Protein required for optimal translation under nutrient stress [Kazachstania saulgeensis]
MSNPFDLLGNDIEDPNATVVPPLKELVRKTTSSKKADVPPPSADPSRARKPRAKPTGNDGAIKDKSAGRQKNRTRDVSGSASERRPNTRRATDRHSRSGKTDTQKKINQGWGNNKDELETEAAAEADADAELAEDAEEKAVDSNKMTLEAYLQSQQSASLNKSVEAKATNKLENAELFFKEEEVYVPATKVKTVKSKQQKAKNFLDFDATFSDAVPKGRRSDNRSGDRNNNNRNFGKNARRGGKKSPQNTVEKNRSIDTANLPSLA